MSPDDRRELDEAGSDAITAAETERIAKWMGWPSDSAFMVQLRGEWFAFACDEDYWLDDRFIFPVLVALKPWSFFWNGEAWVLQKHPGATHTVSDPNPKIAILRAALVESGETE